MDIAGNENALRLFPFELIILSMASVLFYISNVKHLQHKKCQAFC